MRRILVMGALLVLFCTSCASVADEKYEEFTAKAAEIEQYSTEQNEAAQTQADINIASYNVYVKWDMLLNEVYQYLRESMDADAFAALEADELEWIAEKETAIEKAALEWQGGSGEAMVRNGTAARYTKERCYYLLSLIKR